MNALESVEYLKTGKMVKPDVPWLKYLVYRFCRQDKIIGIKINDQSCAGKVEWIWTVDEFIDNYTERNKITKWELIPYEV
jgi:hypothetical protein